MERFFSFDGRIGRGEWWTLSILAIVISIVAVFVAAAILPLLVFPVYLASIVSSWAIGTRRCHDLGWSGAMLLINLIPGIGGLFLLVALGFVPGNSGPNKYGYADGYTPQYIQSEYAAPLRVHNDAPAYLRQHNAIHPSLQEANDRAWQGSVNNYKL